jgi:hypothetical protein
MRRTLSIKVYESGSYNTILDGEAGDSVRLCYAVPVGNVLVLGSTVPGHGFEHIGNGVWERDIETDVINASRTDYYYLQYTEDSGSTWTNVAGYDPFYFNTKISLSMDSMTTQPTISGKTPNTPDVEESAIALVISFDGKFTGGDDVNANYIREFYYAFGSEPADLSGYTKRTTIDDSITVQRIGEETAKDEDIHVRVRVMNPTTGELSQATSVETNTLAVESVGQILTADALVAPNYMNAGDVDETSILGIDDAFTVSMPSLASRGQHSELAIQYGGGGFTIANGELVSFSGTIVPCHTEAITVPKPLFFSEAQNVHLARRIVGYNSSTDWVGTSNDIGLKVTLSNPAKIPIMSENVLEAVVDAVIAKVETSTGETIARKPE